MKKEEIKEYLKRVDEREFKLVDEDKDALQWLIFGYNECARLLNEKEKEYQRLKEIEKEHRTINGELRVENKELKKQLEENQNPLKGIFAQVNDDTLLRDCGNMNAEINELKNQQKKFINYLENMLDGENDIFSVVRVKDVLQKYREIIGGNDV